MNESSQILTVIFHKGIIYGFNVQLYVYKNCDGTYSNCSLVLAIMVYVHIMYICRYIVIHCYVLQLCIPAVNILVGFQHAHIPQAKWLGRADVKILVVLFLLQLLQMSILNNLSKLFVTFPTDIRMWVNSHFIQSLPPTQPC